MRWPGILARTGMRSTRCCTTRAGNSRADCRPGASMRVRRSASSALRGKISPTCATKYQGVSVRNEGFEHWLRNVIRTEDREISCSECFDLVSHFVEVELS